MRVEHQLEVVCDADKANTMYGTVSLVASLEDGSTARLNLPILAVLDSEAVSPK